MAPISRLSSTPLSICSKSSAKVRYLELVRVPEFSQHLIRVSRLKDCPSLRRMTIFRCMQFRIDNIGLESDYPNNIIELNGRTDLHFELEILPYDARSSQGSDFNNIERFPYIARLQRYLPYLIRDHRELIREDTAFRQELLDMEGNGRKIVPAERVLKLLDLGWKGPVIWRRDNNQREDPFIDIIKDLYEMRVILPGDHLTKLYECDECRVDLYGACFSSYRGRLSDICMACRRGNFPDHLDPYPWSDFDLKIEDCCAAAIETKLSALRLRDQQAKAGDLPHDEHFYPGPSSAAARVMTDDDFDDFYDPENESLEANFPSSQSNGDGNDGSNNSKDQKDKDDPRLRRQYTYRQCPSLREIVQVFCSRDEHDPHVHLDSELPGRKPEPKDIPSTADEKKIIKCEFNPDFPFRVVVLNKPVDFEARLKAEEADEEAKRNA